MSHVILGFELSSGIVVPNSSHKPCRQHSAYLDHLGCQLQGGFIPSSSEPIGSRYCPVVLATSLIPKEGR